MRVAFFLCLMVLPGCDFLTEKWHGVMGNCRDLAEHCVGKIDRCELDCANQQGTKAQRACLRLCDIESDACEDRIIRCNVDRDERGLERE